MKTKKLLSLLLAICMLLSVVPMMGITASADSDSITGFMFTGAFDTNPTENFYFNSNGTAVGNSSYTNGITFSATTYKSTQTGSTVDYAAIATWLNDNGYSDIDAATVEAAKFLDTQKNALTVDPDAAGYPGSFSMSNKNIKISSVNGLADKITEAVDIQLSTLINSTTGECYEYLLSERARSNSAFLMNLKNNGSKFSTDANNVLKIDNWTVKYEYDESIGFEEIAEPHYTFMIASTDADQAKLASGAKSTAALETLFSNTLWSFEKVGDSYAFVQQNGEYTVDTTTGIISALSSGYTVTCAECTNGSVSVGDTTSYAENAEVTVTATPDSGYELDEISAYKTGDTSTTIAVTNGTFIMPDYAVTVSATFKQAADPEYNIKYSTIRSNGSNWAYPVGTKIYMDVLPQYGGANTTSLCFDSLDYAIFAGYVPDVSSPYANELYYYEIYDIAQGSVVTLGETYATDTYTVKSGGYWIFHKDEGCGDEFYGSVSSGNGSGSITPDPEKTFSLSDPVCYIDANDNDEFDGDDVKYDTITAALAATKPATETAEKPTVIRMIADSTENVTIPAERYITLDLNGYVLKAKDTGSVITCMEKLTVMDSGSTAKHYFRYSDNSAWTLDTTASSGIAISAITDNTPNGTLIEVPGGCITGGIGSNRSEIYGSSCGGGVYVYATLIMTGGNIVGNSATMGGGVFNYNFFKMTGGRIIGNYAYGGGGVMEFPQNCPNAMLGGTAEIYGNKAGQGNNFVEYDIRLATICTGDEKPATGMKVGVTLCSSSTDSVIYGQFTYNGAADDLQYFFSDSADYTVKYNESEYLELIPVSEISADVSGAGYSASLTLNENIDINFKMTNISVNDESKLVIYVDGEIWDSYKIKDGVLSGVLKAVEPKDIGTAWHIVVTYDNVQVKNFNYSVKSYCKAVFKAQTADKALATPTGKYDKLADLCEALLNYGKYAEDYANGNTDSTVNEGHEATFDENYTFTGLKNDKVTLGNYAGEGSAAYLTLDSTIKLNFILKNCSEVLENDDAETQNFFVLNEKNEQIDPKRVEITIDGTDTLVSIDLYASQLSTSYTLKLKGVDTSKFCITYGVYNYCEDAQYQTGALFTDTVKTLCKAIHNYSEAVQAYIAK